MSSLVGLRVLQYPSTPVTRAMGQRRSAPEFARPAFAPKGQISLESDAVDFIWYPCGLPDVGGPLRGMNKREGSEHVAMLRTVGRTKLLRD